MVVVWFRYEVMEIAIMKKWSVLLPIFAAAPIVFSGSKAEMPPRSILSPGAQGSKPMSGGQQATQGWLILGGTEVPPPFDIQVFDDHLAINGQRALESSSPVMSGTVDASTELRHQVLNGLVKYFQQQARLVSLDLARARALEYARTQPTIVEAQMETSDTLRVLFEGERYSESVYLKPVEEDIVAPDVARAEYLRSQASAIREWLDQGSLVVLDGELVYATSPSDGRTVHEALLEIARSWSRLESRVIEVRKWIPDEAAARRIAERFGN
jgi:hypothetical protein